ncbi:adenylyl transferase [Enterococcus sp. JM4C]|uniref:aminoglycoside adenylyltransferase domain-containing protein n=1 Tax=Candidatus Enterococcus huntleyi TaxID=1857217 RepID=UPI0013794346|nr:aminoglycoside adenylyltransferase domain-containing protein [Enterococcus sp. JM4C]KAF1298160.1 adenylyl transferase [Enterococcus sp. JM4C]
MIDRTGELLELMKIGYSKILRDNLVGIYLHGSYAFGSYKYAVSDLDYLIVVNRQLTEDEKFELMEYTMARLNPIAPKKGLEFHVLELEKTRNLTYPIPFDFHFSAMHQEEYLNNPMQYIRQMKGTDIDLVAHIKITTLYGKVLTGQPISEVFSLVDENRYSESIVSDVKEALADSKTEPMYLILNLCRVLAYTSEKVVLSKEAGGNWGLEKLSVEYGPLIALALAEYQGKKVAVEEYPKDELKILSIDLLKQIDENYL